MHAASWELGLTPTSCRRLVYQGKLGPAFRVGKHVKIRYGDLMQYVERRRVQAKAWATKPRGARQEQAGPPQDGADIRTVG
jgi:excisionase family DNA binding protein